MKNKLALLLAVIMLLVIPISSVITMFFNFDLGFSIFCWDFVIVCAIILYGNTTISKLSKIGGWMFVIFWIYEQIMEIAFVPNMGSVIIACACNIFSVLGIVLSVAGRDKKEIENAED